MYDRFLCTRATKEGKNIKPTTVIPSKSHSAVVFISFLTYQRRRSFQYDMLYHTEILYQPLGNTCELPNYLLRPFFVRW